MPITDLCSKILQISIDTLDQYCKSTKSKFIKIPYMLSYYQSKPDYALGIQIKLKEFAATGNVEYLDSLRKIDKPHNRLTLPPHIDLEEDWGTPRTEASRTPIYPIVAGNSQGTATPNTSQYCGTPVINVKPNLYNVFSRQLQGLHGLREKNNKSPGRLDVLLYAMSRTAFCMEWLEERIDLNVAYPPISYESLSGSFVEISIVEKLYQDTIQLLARYVCCLVFDRSLVRFRDLVVIDKSYSLDSGVYDAFFTDNKALKEIGDIRDSLVRYLIILNGVYESSITDKNSNLIFMLKNLILPELQPLVLTGTKFSEEFENLAANIAMLNHTITDNDVMRTNIVEMTTEEFIDHDPDQDRIEATIAPPALASSHSVSPAPVMIAKPKVLVQ